MTKRMNLRRGLKPIPPFTDRRQYHLDLVAQKKHSILVKPQSRVFYHCLDVAFQAAGFGADAPHRYCLDRNVSEDTPKGGTVKLLKARKVGSPPTVVFRNSEYVVRLAEYRD